jgi:hypothetical protein
MTVTLSQVLAFFHVSNFSNASDDEAMFFYNLFFQFCASAKVLTRKARGTADRALNALVNSLAVMSYDDRMKSKLDSETTPEQKMQRFQGALRRVLQVSKDDLSTRLAEDEKIRRQVKQKPGPKPSASGHAADSKA